MIGVKQRNVIYEFEISRRNLVFVEITFGLIRILKRYIFGIVSLKIYIVKGHSWKGQLKRPISLFTIKKIITLELSIHFFIAVVDVVVVNIVAPKKIYPLNP